MEAEVMCEIGVWKNFDELEDSLILDELFILYEQTGDRQQRLIKTVAAAMGADVSGDGGAMTGDDVHLDYQQQELIGEGGSVLFGYRTKEASGE